MSKQANAKAAQGYVSKAVPQTCMNCAMFASEIVTKGNGAWAYEKETNMRCKMGGFKVMKMGTCDEWRGKQDAAISSNAGGQSPPASGGTSGPPCSVVDRKGD